MAIPQYDLDGLGAEYKVTAAVEEKIAQILGVKHCVMVTSGTAALFLALRAMGAKKVAIPPLTMVGTATAAELAGCEITFVSGTKIPQGIDTYIHVSLNGRDCAIEEIIAKNPGVRILEDACQAFGSKHNGNYLGTFGLAGTFSFQAYKIVSSGNGGCVVTNDDAIARSVRELKNFGREAGGADVHDKIGYNFKFTDIQANFLLPQLHELEERIAAKKAMYARYFEKLSTIMLPHAGTPWFVDVYVNNRGGLASYLKEKGIGTRPMYPLVSWQPPFAHNPTHGDMSQDEKLSLQGLWLPSSLHISHSEIDEVIDAVQSWM